MYSIWYVVHSTHCVLCIIISLYISNIPYVVYIIHDAVHYIQYTVYTPAAAVYLCARTMHGVMTHTINCAVVYDSCQTLH